jgi:Tle cognate immunity protein 4 C-terminal domain/Tle cognate immunity protein 4 N-terminal domain
MMATKLSRSLVDFLLLILCLSAFAACQSKATPMTSEDSQRIDKLTAGAVPRCIGRHLVNLPDGFALNSESASEVEGVAVQVKPMPLSAFDAGLGTYLAKLNATRLPVNSFPVMRSSSKVPGLDKGLLIDRAKSSSSSGRAKRTIELIGWQSGFEIRAWLDAFDGTFPEDAEVQFYRDKGSNVPEKSALLQRVFSRVRGLAPNEIPTEPGLCIANGFVKGPANLAEQTFIPFQLDGVPDVYFGFHSNTRIKEKDTMLERSASIEKQMKAAGSSTIRKGKRTLNGQAVEEWLFRGPTPDHVQGTMFQLQANETAGDPSKPKIELDLYNGFRIPRPELSDEDKRKLGLYEELKKASLTEAEALAIWDKATATLRVRPGAF